MRAAPLASALALALAGCAIHVPAPGPDHPASPRATPGRLAGAPASLRPGVIAYPDVPALRQGPPEVQHHMDMPGMQMP